MIIAKDKTVLQPQVPKAASTGYVVKATHCAGVVNVFVCTLEPDFDCRMPDPDGIAFANRGIGTNGWGPHAIAIGVTTNNITFGAASGSAAGVVDGFDGAIEEMFLYKITLEEVNVSAQ